MAVSTQTGLVSCGICNDPTKHYTPKGLNIHLKAVHHRDICPTCGADKEYWRQELHEEHTCLWPYPDGEGTVDGTR